MELRDALTQITEIRLQMARREVFRGYRAVPAAFSGAVALAAATVQAVAIADPVQQINAFLGLWIGAAVLSAMSAVFEMGVRARNSSSSLTRELTFLAMEQFCPCLVAGADYDGRGPIGARVRLDPAWPLAGAVQSGHLRLVPLAPTVDVRSGGLLPHQRARNPGPYAGRECSEPLGHGASLLCGAIAGGCRAVPHPGEGS